MSETPLEGVPTSLTIGPALNGQCNLNPSTSNLQLHSNRLWKATEAYRSPPGEGSFGTRRVNAVDAIAAFLVLCAARFNQNLL